MNDGAEKEDFVSGVGDFAFRRSRDVVKERGILEKPRNLSAVNGELSIKPLLCLSAIPEGSLSENNLQFCAF